ncbi:MAG: GAF domain-containing protein [Caulobacterales bacterium]|nr:GAF domain-containing protein [Caulobacterales bacterium]MCA0373395.1 GAF domain-containing protein [Pseudomonadota bacterium]
MAEQFLIDTKDKSAAYSALLDVYKSVIDGEDNEIARLSTLISLLTSTFGELFFWCGFYMVDETKNNELVVGPYQGTMGCLRIPFTKGVCGKCAREAKIQIVDDVHAIADHIACDSRSNSEIVVPIFKNGKLHAVLDIDSTEFAAFDEIDAHGLEELVKIIYA